MKLHESSEIVEQCLIAQLHHGDRLECLRINLDTTCTPTCTTYRWPAVMWHNRKCPFAGVEVATGEEKMLNPLKASKRAAGKK